MKAKLELTLLPLGIDGDMIPYTASLRPYFLINSKANEWLSKDYTEWNVLGIKKIPCRYFEKEGIQTLQLHFYKDEELDGFEYVPMLKCWTPSLYAMLLMHNFV